MSHSHSIINTTFRPRPIDINRPLEIHRGILPTEADTGCVRGVPNLPTGMEPEEEEVLSLFLICIIF